MPTFPTGSIHESSAALRRAASSVPPGDLAGLARAYAREHRLSDALDCLEAAAIRAQDEPVPHGRPDLRERAAMDDEPWWSPRRPVDFGGRPRPPTATGAAPRTATFDAPWTAERIAVDRAHLLRRMGRPADAAEVWAALSAGTGRTAIHAAIELAKLHEHRLGNLGAALHATRLALARIERWNHLGHPEPFVEANLLRRAARLRRRLAAADRRDPVPRSTDQPPRPTSGTRGSIGSVAQRSLT